MADRVNEIIEQATKAMWLALHVQNEKGSLPYPRFDQQAIRELLGNAPDDVREEANDLMKAFIAAEDGWARKQDRVIDGRVAIIALHLLACQHFSIMQAIADEGVGPRGPHATGNN